MADRFARSGETASEKENQRRLIAKRAPQNTPKLFIGGISPATTQECFRAYFEQFGDLVDSVIMVDKNTNKGRGFGFVTYKDPPTANFVSTLVHIIDGKKVDCKKARPRETPVDPIASDPNFKTSKIFVGGLPPDLTVDGLRDYFMQYGEVVDCVIVSDKETKQSRCFGFVQFTTCQAVEDVIKQYYKIIINNKWVECKKALPKETCSELLKNQQKTQPKEQTMKNNTNSLPMPADLYQPETSKPCNIPIGLSNGQNVLGTDGQGFYQQSEMIDPNSMEATMNTLNSVNPMNVDLYQTQQGMIQMPNSQQHFMDGVPMEMQPKLEQGFIQNMDPQQNMPGQMYSDQMQGHLPLQQRPQNWVKREHEDVPSKYKTVPGMPKVVPNMARDSEKLGFQPY